MEDEQIMRDVRAGEVGKLETLFDRHSRALLHYFLHLTGPRAVSEDMVQELWQWLVWIVVGPGIILFS